ncbi:MAG TPA: phosphoribosylglycinamide formyltransferase [Aquabacterium sp.]|nr:phosphoribosylglycinamide formyltransferase [Aquabacterium sp.]
MKRIVILISGRGSNMEAIVQRCAAEGWPAQVVAVISNRPQARGLEFARAHGIATAVVDHKQYTLRTDFDTALATAIDAHEPDLVVLAGFMRVLGTEFVDHYAGRMLNIHPSLLPAFPGLHTHRAAIEAGCKLAGATVHFVTSQLDHGPIVMQSAVPVRPGDDEAALAARVLATEHVIYPQSVRWFVEGQLLLEGGRVVHRAGAAQLLVG